MRALLLAALVAALAAVAPSASAGCDGSGTLCASQASSGPKNCEPATLGMSEAHVQLGDARVQLVGWMSCNSWYNTRNMTLNASDGSTLQVVAFSQSRDPSGPSILKVRVVGPGTDVTTTWSNDASGCRMTTLGPIAGEWTNDQRPCPAGQPPPAQPPIDWGFLRPWADPSGLP